MPCRDSARLKTLVNEDRYASSTGLELNEGYPGDKNRHPDEKDPTTVGWNDPDDRAKDSFTIHKDAWIPHDSQLLTQQ
ncbi:hypothetical protein N7499_004425 [Penicillium canescens]|uniref:Uncharacterized protein n=1 Tax=Penicillium canescens TaxID=5083 RepID=A0AAD6N8D4_PENCN|nr:uncharacterized protein N7446_005282 [Penicillium canescens]KAJ6038477.1 hypothetical protein N7460_008248 [Penicillium canescens]KAJ6039462.1 hypothetical protein N7444_008367 [Penicillium canescens]KAJ6068245.1 hypothetical protein N7446_005282 [Penicillium canescens]KAJ6084796.1 hypothetical protein N7499_004425 [Penicillium canescens]KAJ6161582.1 hypothetical protein N7485_009812 [Penicillium canescens]